MPIKDASIQTSFNPAAPDCLPMTPRNSTKHEKHPFVSSQSCTDLRFWDPVLFPMLCSISHCQRQGRFPFFPRLMLFLWLDVKLPGLCLFWWFVNQCLRNKTFYWDNCHLGWVLSLDGRNQSIQVPSVHQWKTPRTYILSETKWNVFFLPRFGDFHSILFQLLRH